MSKNKQSSIDWLVEKLGKYNEEMIFLCQTEIEKAKAMHKEEIIEAIMFGDCRGKIYTYSTLEEYYNETYK